MASAAVADTCAYMQPLTAQCPVPSEQNAYLLRSLGSIIWTPISFTALKGLPLVLKSLLIMIFYLLKLLYIVLTPIRWLLHALILSPSLWMWSLFAPVRFPHQSKGSSCQSIVWEHIWISFLCLLDWKCFRRPRFAPRRIRHPGTVQHFQISNYHNTRIQSRCSFKFESSRLDRFSFGTICQGETCQAAASQQDLSLCGSSSSNWVCILIRRRRSNDFRRCRFSHFQIRQARYMGRCGACQRAILISFTCTKPSS